MDAVIHKPHPDIEDLWLYAVREVSCAERIQLAAEMTGDLRRLVKQAIRRRYPNADGTEQRCRFAALWLGREWAIRVYGWDPEQHGW